LMPSKGKFILFPPLISVTYGAYQSLSYQKKERRSWSTNTTTAEGKTDFPSFHLFLGIK